MSLRSRSPSPGPPPRPTSPGAPEERPPPELIDVAAVVALMGFAAELAPCLAASRDFPLDNLFHGSVARARQGPRRRAHLMAASVMGRGPRVAELLALGAPPNARDRDGASALSLAVRSDASVECVRELLRPPPLPRPTSPHCRRPAVDIEARDAVLDYSPLMWASSVSAVACMALLLDAGCKIDALTMPECGRLSALAVAAAAGRADAVSLLLDRSAATEIHDSNGNTPLLHTAGHGLTRIAAELLRGPGAAAAASAADGGAAAMGDVDASDPPRPAGRSRSALEARNNLALTPLALSAHKGHSETLAVLIAAGGDIEAFDNGGRTPLGLAAQFGQMACLRQLLDAGAAIDAQDDLLTSALIVAAEQDHLDVVRELLTRGANVHLRDNEGYSALARAAERGSLAGVALLADAGGQLEVGSNEGFTPTMLAAQMGHTAVVTALVGRGAKVDARNNFGASALMWAADSQHGATVAELVRLGADVDGVNHAGESALMWASSSGLSAMARRLVRRHGAALELKDGAGRTAVVHAARDDHPHTIATLAALGANLRVRDAAGDCALAHACARGSRDSVRALLSGGTDLGLAINAGEDEDDEEEKEEGEGEERDRSTAMPADLAPSQRSCAAPNARNNLGETALMASCAAGKDSCVAALLGPVVRGASAAAGAGGAGLASGVAIDLTDYAAGETALMKAAAGDSLKHVKCADLLLSEGAHARLARASDGATALDIAMAVRPLNVEMATLLRSFGAL